MRYIITVDDGFYVSTLSLYGTSTYYTTEKSMAARFWTKRGATTFLQQLPKSERNRTVVDCRKDSILLADLKFLFALLGTVAVVALTNDGSFPDDVLAWIAVALLLFGFWWPITHALIKKLADEF